MHTRILLHLFWVDNDSSTLHRIWELSMSSVPVTFTIRDLGDVPDFWIRRFIRNVVKDTEIRMRHGYWASETEYVTLVVGDLRSQLHKSRCYVRPGLPRYNFPFLKKV